MTAQWISSGEAEPSVPLKPLAEPYREWEIGRFRFRRSRQPGRWSCEATDGSAPLCGAASFRTPFGAFLAVLRMLRTS